MTITVRRAKREDAAEIARLNEAFNDLRATPDQIAAQIDACAGIETMFLAAVDGAVVGMASLRLLPTFAIRFPMPS